MGKVRKYFLAAVRCAYLALEVCTELETHNQLLFIRCRAPFPNRLTKSARLPPRDSLLLEDQAWKLVPNCSDQHVYIN
jgi:hypothetical protein